MTQKALPRNFFVHIFFSCLFGSLLSASALAADSCELFNAMKTGSVNSATLKVAGSLTCEKKNSQCHCRLGPGSDLEAYQALSEVAAVSVTPEGSYGSQKLRKTVGDFSCLYTKVVSPRAQPRVECGFILGGNDANENGSPIAE